VSLLRHHYLVFKEQNQNLDNILINYQGVVKVFVPELKRNHLIVLCSEKVKRFSQFSCNRSIFFTVEKLSYYINDIVNLVQRQFREYR